MSVQRVDVTNETVGCGVFASTYFPSLVFVWSLHVIAAPAWVFSRYSHNTKDKKKSQVNHYSVGVSVNGCLFRYVRKKTNPTVTGMQWILGYGNGYGLSSTLKAPEPKVFKLSNHTQTFKTMKLFIYIHRFNTFFIELHFHIHINSDFSEALLLSQTSLK